MGDVVGLSSRKKMRDFWGLLGGGPEIISLFL